MRALSPPTPRKNSRHRTTSVGRPHPGAQLTLTDTDGHRVTCFATNDPSPGLLELEAHHRQRARREDRIKARLGHRRERTCPTQAPPPTPSGSKSSYSPSSSPLGRSNAPSPEPGASHNPTADDWNHGDRHLGPRDEQPRPHRLTPGKSKTRRDQRPRRNGWARRSVSLCLARLPLKKVRSPNGF